MQKLPAASVILMDAAEVFSSVFRDDFAPVSSVMDGFMVTELATIVFERRQRFLPDFY